MGIDLLSEVKIMKDRKTDSRNSKNTGKDKVLKILLLEDNPDDVILTRRMLNKNNIEHDLYVVSNEKDYSEYIRSNEFNLILSDFKVPGFNGFEALKIYKQNKCKKPFIILSGTIGEEKAIEVLKSGATDYVIKENLKKLPLAIDRAMEEYQKSLDKKQVEEDKNRLILDLKRHNEELQNFVHIISHNLRGPVATLLGLVSIFNRDDSGDPINLTVINEIGEKCNILNESMNDLKDSISSIEINESEKELIFLEEVVSNIKKLISDKFRNYDNEILTDFRECEYIFSKKSYLTNILYNLINNAIKHRSPKRTPKIRVRAGEDKEYFKISVSDNGIGMDFSRIDKNKIFGFYQKFNLNSEGKGLGLYLVKMQVDSLHGKITVASKPDKGSKFTVYLKK